MAMEQIVVLLIDLNQSLISTPLLTIELETLALSWAIYYIHAHLTFAPTWEKLVVYEDLGDMDFFFNL
jgi:hypothetical protein